MQFDNSTYELKAQIRTRSLSLIESAVVLETHGGYGRLFQRCYFGIKDGVVFEKQPDKADALAVQRPTWAVYEADPPVSRSRAPPGTPCGARTQLILKRPARRRYVSELEATFR